MADTGWVTAGTIAEDGTVGNGAWANVANAKTSNDSYADWSENAQPNGTLFTSKYLKATNFGLSVPGGATINGVEVRIERKWTVGAAGENIIEADCKLVKGGTISGDDKADGSTVPSSDTYKTYGGAAQLWGLTLADTDVNASTFGFVWSFGDSNFAACITGGAVVDVDDMQVKVYYTEAASGPPLGSMATLGVGK